MTQINIDTKALENINGVDEKAVKYQNTIRLLNNAIELRGKEIELFSKWRNTLTEDVTTIVGTLIVCVTIAYAITKIVSAIH